MPRMLSGPHKVYVIVDRNFGERLAALPEATAVWIVDTSANKPVAQRLWEERTPNYPVGITTFLFDLTSSPEAIFVSELDTIELHHPGHTQFEVFGARLDEQVKTELTR